MAKTRSSSAKQNATTNTTTEEVTEDTRRNPVRECRNRSPKATREVRRNPVRSCRSSPTRLGTFVTGDEAMRAVDAYENEGAR